MDTELARTFLAVVATGSFVAASQRLHVTQSTVSVRIQRLEKALGAELFPRNKGGTTLTPAGRRPHRLLGGPADTLAAGLRGARSRRGRAGRGRVRRRPDAGLDRGERGIGVMYTPQARPGRTVELLLEERLVMVSTLGLNQIRTSGGSGYFPLRMVREDDRAGKLHRVPGVPEFRMPAYLCFPPKAASPPLELALETPVRIIA